MGQTAERRSQRILLDMPVVIRGESPERRAFEEETFTVTVSAHGLLLMLAEIVSVGQKLRVFNPSNRDEREGRVAYRGSVHAGLAQVGIEFTQPAPDFWPVNPPPRDWNSN